VASIQVDTSINDFPATGILMIDNEAFVYSSKNNATRRFGGITRAARGTSMAGHTAGAVVWWVQHDVFILYGNSSPGSAPQDEAWKSGMMNINSSQSKWRWDDIKTGDGVYHQVAAWNYFGIDDFNQRYTAPKGTVGNPANAIGVEVSDQGRGMWFIDNPCGWSNVKFSGDNERRAHVPAHWDGRIVVDGAIVGLLNGVGRWNHSIAAPTTADTWETWAADEAIPSNIPRGYVALWLRDTAGTGDSLYLDGGGIIELDIVSGNEPVVTLGAEQGNYALDATLTNETTGDALRVTFNMTLGETIEIDTVNKRVTYLLDGSSQYQALEVIGLRREWLPLKPGNNTIVFLDKGAEEVELKLLWRTRNYG
jgi:hypothetical protein